MAEHNILGSKGEDAAAKFLEEQGFSILHRNWRVQHKEVDIVALDGRFLVFVEVKTRTTRMELADVISNFKINALRDAAEAYIERFARTEEMRFDVVMLIPRNSGYEIEHVRDAFR